MRGAGLDHVDSFKIQNLQNSYALRVFYLQNVFPRQNTRQVIVEHTNKIQNQKATGRR